MHSFFSKWMHRCSLELTIFVLPYFFPIIEIVIRYQM
jgi:hypothetical protein